MTIYEREPRFVIFGFEVGHIEKVAEVGRIIFRVEHEDIEGELEGTWHGHFFKVSDPDTLIVGRIERLTWTKTSEERELTMRLVPGYKLEREKINENPSCKGRVRWQP